jgi:NodT family efflux transporter outer membrane factor (OMF) lipoprotein
LKENAMNAFRPHALAAATFAAVAVLLSGCKVGPDYVRPAMEAPAAYREPAPAGWKAAQPGDHLERGQWWTLYNDPQLSGLVEQVSVSNQNILVAQANYRQSQALVQQARAGYFPTVGAGASATRSQAGSRGVLTTGNNYNLGVDASWEIDLWGQVGRSVESSRAGAQASAGDLESITLSSQAALVQNYFLLRMADLRKRILDNAVANFQRNLTLVQNQYKAGVVARSDVVQAEAQLRSTQAQSISVGVSRAQLEHSIAVLIGKAPAEFSLPPIDYVAVLPTIPTGLPSELLERRPDIAAAERRAAAANAQIGVAKAALFPSLNLSAAGGFASSSFANWLTIPSRFWTLGPALAQVLFDGGLRQAITDQAIATYDGTAAAYRQTVLNGFQEVEDNLAALRILEEQALVQAEAVKASRLSVEIITNQYKTGIVSYLNVVVVQAGALNNETAAVQILSDRLLANVLLVKALGGGWDASALPTAEQISQRER